MANTPTVPVRELVADPAPTPSCHAATVAELGDGSLAAAWFGGEREGAPDVGIWLARSSGDGWAPPVQVASARDVPCWNPVLHRCRSGELLLFYKSGPSPQTWSGRVLRSDDDGVTWGRREALPPGILGPIKNKPVELSDGALVCGSSVESHNAWGCWIELTPDAGRSWSKHGPIHLARVGLIQPALFGGGDRLAMICRTAGLDTPVRSESHDGGCTWSTPEPLDLPHNNSGLDAVALSDGRVVLVYNHTLRGRSPLNLAVSEDFGHTWRPGPVLEDAPGEYSYPAIIQVSDGTVHVVYTWRRERIAHVSLDPREL